MWIRNIVFIGLVVGVAVALRVNLFPARTSAQERAAVQPRPPPDVTAEVDRLFRAHWVEAALEPTEKAADLTVLRRLALALTGAVPSLEEIRRFESLPAEVRLRDWLDRALKD